MAASTSHRSFVWLILLAAFAAGVGLYLGNRQFGAPRMPALENAVLYPRAHPVPDFHLQQADGKPLTPADWQGRWNVVYFGYTSCPDVCPTTLATFKATWKLLGERGLQPKVRFDFVSVDPERDTPQRLAQYVGFFSPDFIAATGSDGELTRLTRSLGLVYSRTKKPDGTVEVDHSGSAVIVDPQARVVGIFRPPFSAPALARDLGALVATSG